ncbi:hypothetical protein bpr_II194 (plasmid) [Butyrivibrio proteoclasticus B316]|uniref:Wadjet protein JetD C-terminal domain-containing protein n=1 Tax=Butyrivibrio proteoclasticus (strain ATCC 51982 / DSM 14932 / B316) TaxID=515622 RepID=E0S400_BUTPB|nr:Wadjet anti-phage system protein JetD domain-containing protein [Butyrivibrio proteoclasticus]ADL36132.1 hypothetical protein bpr_II194 [Butyrivibrio proteoclasticus B316]
MADKQVKLNKRQKDVLKALLDKLEKSKTYRGENTVSQNFRVNPADFFKEYDSDFANLDDQDDFERELDTLEKAGLVTLFIESGVIKSIDMVLSAQDKYYSLLERIELKQLEEMQISMYKAFLGRNKLIDLFCNEQIARLQGRKKAEYDIPIAKEVIGIIEYISQNKEEILERELSIELFGDSKKFEKEYRNKVITVLKKYGEFSDLVENIPDDTELGHAILAEYNVFKNPTYVNFKGKGTIWVKDGEKLELNTSMPVAIDSSTLERIDSVMIKAQRIVTVENLTSFNRLQDKNTFFIYLAGYHNTDKQNFIRKIAETNLFKTWYHFGDIDPDGFYILEHLKKKTGIAFSPLGMGIEELTKYKEYCKPLESNDLKKAKSLVDKGLYEDIVQYMLENNVKLEQEVISWKQLSI